MRSNTTSVRMCALCGIIPEDPKVCSVCKSVTYCGRECQKAHFKRHKRDCIKPEYVAGERLCMAIASSDRLGLQQFDNVLAEVGPNVRDRDNNTSLEFTARMYTMGFISRQSCLHVIIRLIRAQVDLDAVGDMKQTALMVLAKSGDFELWNLVLEAGADYSLIDNQGFNTLHTACVSSPIGPGHERIIERLVQVCSSNRVTATQFLNMRTNECYTPLIYAIRDENLRVVKLLLSHGASVYVPPRSDADTKIIGNGILPLSEARKHGPNNSILRFLREHLRSLPENEETAWELDMWREEEKLIMWRDHMKRLRDVFNSYYHGENKNNIEQMEQQEAAVKYILQQSGSSLSNDLTSAPSVTHNPLYTATQWVMSHRSYDLTLTYPEGVDVSALSDKEIVFLMAAVVYVEPNPTPLISVDNVLVPMSYPEYSLIIQNPLSNTYSFSVPTPEAVEAILPYGPLIELGAGTGYWTSVLRSAGADIIACDLYPPKIQKTIYNRFFVRCYIDDMLKGDGIEIIKSPIAANRTLLLVWPYQCEESGDARQWDADALKVYTSNTVIHVGELAARKPIPCPSISTSSGFERYLLDHFELVKALSLPRLLVNAHDELTIWQRK